MRQGWRWTARTSSGDDADGSDNGVRLPYWDPWRKINDPQGRAGHGKDKRTYPHWDTAYPWKANLTTLPDNWQAVEKTFRNTEKCLEKKPTWKAAYKEQIHEMVSKGAAAKLTREEINSWEGPK